MNPTNKSIVTNFIEEIWNQNQFSKIDNYIANNFVDHSLPPPLPANKDGLKRWVIGTGKSFEHKTIIEESISENDKTVLKIKMQLKHIGEWRGIGPTHSEIETVGYRLFKLADGKIIEHWALIDGNAIENQLKEISKGCKIQA